MVSYLYHPLFNVVRALLLSLVVLAFIDILLLFLPRDAFNAKRILPEKFSNGDENEVQVELKNHYGLKVTVRVIDEIPFQFQVRNFEINRALPQTSSLKLAYKLRPTERGEYEFGSLNVYVSTLLGLVSKRYQFQTSEMVPTYPSFIQLRKYDLMASTNNLVHFGIKKIRRIGHSMEFEQIKEYVQGDDLRTVNWKATAKRGELMVNQFQDEKSQPIYSIIDKGRNMQMPFDGLSLLDYAINASLVVSNVALKKHDKAGICTFSKQVENMVFAERRQSQMNLILEALYNIKTNFYESDFSRLYADVKRHITHRSLILLYTNFETLDSLHRQLPYLKGIAKNHLLVVIFFKNTELNQLIESDAITVQQAYDKVIAEKFVYEKRLIVNELRKYGINAVLTTPEDLTLDTINKYLEFKAKGLI